MNDKSINLISKKINFKKINKTKIKNILITGCSGFIGTYLINSLLNGQKSKLNIYGIDIIKADSLKNKPSFYFFKRNLYKIKNFSLNKKIDLIIHLAGIPSPTFYKKKPLETFYLNCELTKIFLTFAKKKKVDLFISVQAKFMEILILKIYQQKKFMKVECHL